MSYKTSNIMSLHDGVLTSKIHDIHDVHRLKHSFSRGQKERGSHEKLGKRLENL